MYFLVFVLNSELEIWVVVWQVSENLGALVELSFFALGSHVINFLSTVIGVRLNVILAVLRMQHGIDKHSESPKSSGITIQSLSNILSIQILEIVKAETLPTSLRFLFVSYFKSNISHPSLCFRIRLEAVDATFGVLNLRIENYFIFHKNTASDCHPIFIFSLGYRSFQAVVFHDSVGDLLRLATGEEEIQKLCHEF